MKTLFLMCNIKLLLVTGCVLGMVGSSSLLAQVHISLDSARSLALEHNRSIEQAQQNLTAAEAAESSVKAADKPTLDASVVGLYLGEPFQTMLPEYSLNGSLALSEVVYAGGKIRNSKKMARSSVVLQASQKELTISDIMLQTETAYWRLVSAEQRVLLAETHLHLLDTLLQDLNNSFEVGVIYKNDLLRVQVQQNAGEIALQEARDGLEISKRTFAHLTGLETLNFSLVTDIPDLELEPVLVNDLSSAIGQRSEIKMLEEAVTIQETQAELLKGDRRPSLAVTVNGIYAAGQQANFTDGSDNFTSVIGLVSLNVPIWDWGSRKQKVKEQMAKAQVQKLELADTRELLDIEIRAAYLALKRSRLNVVLCRESLNQAEENLRLLKDQYDTGANTGKDVLEGQVMWQRAMAELIDAKASWRIRESEYRKAIAEY